MKKAIVIVGLAALVAAGAAVVLFRSLSPGEVSASELSPKSAAILQAKVDAIKKAEEISDRKPSAEQVEVSEIELESYVLFALREKIPVQLDSIDVQLGEGTVAADTQMTFNSDSTGNPIVDAVVSGTHNLFVKGKLAADQGRGKFDLEEVRVDGIPVPKVLIQTLFDKYVKPKYPDADLKEPFDMPWGIESLAIVPGKAAIAY
ncbi:MAG: hypothetical protein HY646_18585 [Acidobacteria bacterium]|nr:hypothetical protein [Acidobacteriota bacterium]